MATDLYADFNDQYSNVAAKLKKRFLRKPNLQEVLNEFIVLANQCMDSEQPAIAGHTFVMAAKCENTMGNFLGEAECLVSAARQFMKEEQKLMSLKICSPARENLESAIGCYMQAVTKYPEDSPLRTSLYLELANALYSMRIFTEAVSFYEQAIETFPPDHALRVKYLRVLMETHIDTENHPAALDVCSRLCEFDGRSKTATIQREVLINGIFLVLLVEPPKEKIPSSLRKVFTALENERDNLKIDVLEPNLCLKIESILMSYTTKDKRVLLDLYSECTFYLNTHQRELFERLIRKLEQRAVGYD